METVATRLRLIRIAYGRIHGIEREMSQSAISRIVGVKVQAWNNVESGANQIGIDSAIKLRAKTGATLDYIFLGDPSALPHMLAVEIAKLKRRHA